jgi:hypothetical protein
MPGINVESWICQLYFYVRFIRIGFKPCMIKNVVDTYFFEFEALTFLSQMY